MLWLLGACVGACVGSFAANAAVRYGQSGCSVLHGRSKCPGCSARLGVPDLVPILSWLALRGHCRHCGRPIRGIYPGIELAAMFIGATSAGLLPPVEAGLSAVLGWTLLLLSAIDLEKFLLPDRLTLPLLLAGILLATGQQAGLLTARLPSLTEALIGALAGYCLFAAVGWGYRRLRGRDGLGMGDAKLLAAGLAWIGPAWLPLIVLCGALCGLALAVVTGAWRRGDAPIPFGPPLAVTIWCAFVLERVADS